MPKRKQTRRARGDGGLYQRADGMWMGTVDLEPGLDGKRRRKTVSSKDKATTLTKLRELRRKVDNGELLDVTKVTVAAWLDRWCDDITRPNVKPTTYRSYRGIIDNWITPLIGTKPLAKLTPMNVRELSKAITDAGKSTRTAELAYVVLKRALDDAVKERMIPRNPAEHVAKPKVVSKDRGALTTDQARKLILDAIADGDLMATRWAAALLLGARQGELLGLQWDRVDLETGTVDLSWQLQWLPVKPDVTMTDPKRFDVPAGFEHRPLYRTAALTRPKTKRSQRIVPLPAPLVVALFDYQASTEPNPHGLVWATPSGNPIPNKYDSNAWHAALTRSKLPEVPLHAARHTTATLLLEAGVEESVRMAIMGHSSVAAQRSYAHIDQHVARRALGNLDKLLEPTHPPE